MDKLIVLHLSGVLLSNRRCCIRIDFVTIRFVATDINEVSTKVYTLLRVVNDICEALLRVSTFLFLLVFLSRAIR